MKVENNKKKIIISVTVIFLLLLIVGASYAYILLQKGQTTSNVIKSTCLKLDIVDVNDSAINLSSAYPMSEEEAKSLTPYKFKIVNRCDVNTVFTIKLDVLNTENKLKNEYVAVSLDNENKRLLTGLTESTNIITYDDYTVDKSYILASGEVEKNGEKEYDLRLWMDESAGNDAMNKTFLSKISIDATQSENQLYVDKELNGADPVIKEGLVPVVIANDGTVKKANLNDKWYDYENSIWANAVILTDNTNYNDGEVIPEDNIESYFVWIPKYKYKLFNVNGDSIDPQEIEIDFGTTNTDNSDSSCVATNESGNDGTCENGKWMTHPAFTSLGVNGIWVGKFETGYKGSTDTESARKNENNPTKVQIKPNVNSWSGITISNIYNTSFNYKRNLDSHMMKNTEWGAVAYLTNSKYGRPKDENGVPTEVWINNNGNYVTGCVGNSVTVSQYDGCQNAWNTDGGRHASTTDNISGIYDMSGGTWEYVMVNYKNNLDSEIIDKYVDKYTGDNTSYRILGDATSETQGWNSDHADFVSSNSPWFVRGGSPGITNMAGIFSFRGVAVDVHNAHGFHLVLSPAA